MALWRKSFSNLGGTDYVADPRVAEAQRQQQLAQQQQQADRAFQLSQQQLQQSQAQNGWKNKLAQDDQILRQMQAEFQFGEDAQGLRARQADLPWAQLGENTRQFDSRQGLAQDQFGLQRERFDYGKSMAGTPEEAAAMRELEALVAGDRARASGVLNSDEALQSRLESMIAEQQGSVVRNNPDFLRASQEEALRGSKLANENASIDMQRNLAFGDDVFEAQLDALLNGNAAAAFNNDLNMQYSPLEREFGIRSAASQAQAQEAEQQRRAEDQQRRNRELQLKEVEAASRMSTGQAKVEAQQKEARFQSEVVAQQVQSMPEFQALVSGEVDPAKYGEQISSLLAITPENKRADLVRLIRANQSAIVDAGQSALAPMGTALASKLPDWAVWGDPAAEYDEARLKAQQLLDLALKRFE